MPRLLRRIVIIAAKWMESIRIRRNAQCSKNRFSSEGEAAFSIGFDIDRFKKYKTKLLTDAQKVLEGWFQIYDYNPYCCEVPDWHTDPVTGHRCISGIYHGLISSKRLLNKVDIKNFWEQSNQHWLVTLAEAYHLTNDENFARKIVDLISDWVSKNNCGVSINWKCTMDVSIRACNWVLALSLISRSQSFEKSFDIIAKHLQEHLEFIANNLESKGERFNNHYIANLVGMIWISSYFIILGNNEDWLMKNLYFAVDELEKQLEVQLFESGMDYELSTYYHCFVSEMIIHTLMMLESNGLSYPKMLKVYASRMIDVCRLFHEELDEIPLIGDQDGSRLFHLAGCFDVRRNDFSDMISLFDSVYSNHERSNLVLLEQELAESGIYVLRNDQWTCFVRCGQVGTGGKGTHDHNDHLSIVLYLEGTPVIIDPGTGYYTKDLAIRYLMRSTKMHNTLSVDNLEQNDIRMENPFGISSSNASNCHLYNQTTFVGSFNYSTSQRKIEHKRTISLLQNEVEIIDELSLPNGPNETLDAEVSFILPVTKESILEEGGKLTINAGENICCSLEFFSASAIIVEANLVSTKYGRLETGSRVSSRFYGTFLKTRISHC